MEKKSVKDRSKERDIAFTRLLAVSHRLSLLLCIIPLGYLVLMFSIGVSAASDTAEIYIRNISSVVALLLTGAFFELYYLAHSEYQYSINFMPSLKKVTTFLAIAAVIKVVISAYYLYFCITRGNIVLLFYIGEILAWSSIAVFAYYYLKRMKK